MIVIAEQGLCVKASEGWILITGCAHPGIAKMAAQARKVTGGPLVLVLGGFHMAGYSKTEVQVVLERFRDLEVQRVAPCHCTGEGARKMFREQFGENCTLAGVGSVFQFDGGEE